MFKIEYIQYNNQAPIYFKECTFVYGDNSVGKTILFNTINYILGHADESGLKNFWLSDGLKNITTITCKISNDGHALYLQRNNNREFFFKQSEDERFVLVNRDQYISKIQTSILLDNGRYASSYFEATENRLTFRGFSYMNLVDEYSLGLVNCIYRSANDVSMYSRIRDQMAFLFDHERLMTIIKLRSQIAKKEKDISNYSLRIEKESYLRGVIKDLFEKLKLSYSDSMMENRETFNNYLSNNFSQKSEKNEQDLMFLLTMSAELENQINSLKVYSIQTKKMQDDLKSENALLKFYKSILLLNPEYVDYIKAIQKQIEENFTNSMFLGIRDDNRTLEILEGKKKEVDEKIGKIKRLLSKTNYIERQVWIDSLKKAFKDYEFNSNFNKVEQIRIELDGLKKQLKSEEKVFKGSINDNLNTSILEKYKSLEKSGIDFVKEDFEQEEFSLIFVPSTLSIIAKRNITKKTKASSAYNAGSKARLTVWQLFTCLSIIEYIRKAFPNFPILPLLVIDGIQEPFDDTGVLENVYDLLKNDCKNSNIQLIVMSTRRLTGQNPFDIDISDGLNKEYKD